MKHIETNSYLRSNHSLVSLTNPASDGSYVGYCISSETRCLTSSKKQPKETRSSATFNTFTASQKQRHTNMFFFLTQILLNRKVEIINSICSKPSRRLVVFLSVSKKMMSTSTMGSQVFGVQVEVLLKEESTNRRTSRRLRRAVSLFLV